MLSTEFRSDYFRESRGFLKEKFEKRCQKRAKNQNIFDSSDCRSYRRGILAIFKKSKRKICRKFFVNIHQIYKRTRRELSSKNTNGQIQNIKKK